MKEIQLLEAEIELLQDNLKRLKIFIKEHEDSKYKPYSSHVFGELKHRMIALKQRFLAVSNLSTIELFR